MDLDTPTDAPETTSNRCKCNPDPAKQETLGTTHARPPRSKEEMVETKVSARSVTMVTKAPAQQTKPQTSTGRVHTMFQKVKQQWEQERQLAWQKAEQQLENAPVKEKIPEITKEMPHQITEGEAPKQVHFHKPEENLRPPLSHPFSDDVVYLK